MAATTTAIPPQELESTSTSLGTGESTLAHGIHAAGTNVLDGNKCAGDAAEQHRTKIRFTLDMTAAIMLLFRDCKRENMFSTRRDLCGKVWERVSVSMKANFSSLVCSPKKVENKYMLERRRYKIWKSFEQQLDVIYDTETRTLNTTNDQRWKCICNANGGAHRVNWLKTTPLGDLDVYNEVFEKEKQSAENIASVEMMCARIEAEHKAAALARQKRARGTSDFDNSDGAPAGLTVVPRATKRPIHRWPAQTVGESSELVEAAQNLKDALEIYNSSRKTPARSEFAIAVKDFLAHYGKQLAPAPMARCLIRLQNDDLAFVWNSVKDTAVREGFIEWWAKDA